MIATLLKVKKQCPYQFRTAHTVDTHIIIAGAKPARRHTQCITEADGRLPPPLNTVLCKDADEVELCMVSWAMRYGYLKRPWAFSLWLFDGAYPPWEAWRQRALAAGHLTLSHGSFYRLTEKFFEDTAELRVLVALREAP